MYALSHHNEGLPASGELPATRAPRFNGTVISFASGEEVVGAGDPTKNYFRVIRGLFRAVNFTPDGRRQVFAFYTSAASNHGTRRSHCLR